MVWPGKKNGKYTASSSSPIAGESSESPDREARSWSRTAGIIGVLVFLGAVLGAGLAGGKAMERKAEKYELEAVRVNLSDATARARAEYDTRLDRLEQERADHAATLRAIADRLQSIDRKLDRNERTPRRTP